MHKIIGDSIEINYKDKTYRRSINYLGTKLSPHKFEPEKKHSQNLAKEKNNEVEEKYTCKDCEFYMCQCWGKDNICDSFKIGFSIEKEEVERWPKLGDVSSGRLNH